MPGLSHHILQSTSLGHAVSYSIRTPPGYEENSSKRYPVIYSLHGAGGNESADAFNEFSAKLNEAKIDNKVVVLPDTKHNLRLYYERSVMDLLAFLGEHIKN